MQETTTDADGQEGQKQMVKTLIRQHLTFHQFCSRSRGERVSWRNVSGLTDDYRNASFEPKVLARDRDSLVSEVCAATSPSNLGNLCHG